LKTLKNTNFAEQIISWYQNHQRNLPWRTTTDPYPIWLSEIILQQTRVAQGMPYYQKFISKYPTVYDLAAAPEQEVLRLWQGLGYYARARNLHACAKTVVNEHAGVFPDTYQGLKKLKGIGEYTAAAIASFAFNETVPVVDGNVYRVLSRVFGITDDISSSKGQKEIRKMAEQLVPEGKAYLYNQAIMEFGALQCTPQNPACLLCPVHAQCYAFQQGQQHVLPVNNKKISIKQRYFHYLVVRHDNKLLLQPRKAQDIWAGLYEFYLVEQPDKLQTAATLNDPLFNLLQQKEVIITEIPKVYEHQLTHQRLFVKFFEANIKDKNFMDSLLQKFTFAPFSIEEVKELPKPILIDKFLTENYF
jgi:A/G-specific adenine glycosylase